MRLTDDEDALILPHNHENISMLHGLPKVSTIRCIQFSHNLISKTSAKTKVVRLSVQQTLDYNS